MVNPVTHLELHIDNVARVLRSRDDWLFDGHGRDAPAGRYAAYFRADLSGDDIFDDTGMWGTRVFIRCWAGPLQCSWKMLTPASFIECSLHFEDGGDLVRLGPSILSRCTLTAERRISTSDLLVLHECDVDRKLGTSNAPALSCPRAPILSLGEARRLIRAALHTGRRLSTRVASEGRSFSSTQTKLLDSLPIHEHFTAEPPFRGHGAHHGADGSFWWAGDRYFSTSRGQDGTAVVQCGSALVEYLGSQLELPKCNVDFPDFKFG